MTRGKLIAALASCENKRERTPSRKHGNIPL
jgi:acetyl-CoA carboxylase carboxyltransferase component